MHDAKGIKIYPHLICLQNFLLQVSRPLQCYKRFVVHLDLLRTNEAAFLGALKEEYLLNHNCIVFVKYFAEK